MSDKCYQTGGWEILNIVTVVLSKNGQLASSNQLLQPDLEMSINWLIKFELNRVL